MTFQRIKESAKKKVISKKGDSIAEVLIALLISSLALVMLASMITSSSKIITRSKTKMQNYYLESDELAAPPSNPSNTDTIKISSSTLNISTNAPVEYSVYYYGSTGFQNVVSFRKAP